MCSIKDLGERLPHRTIGTAGKMSADVDAANCAYSAEQNKFYWISNRSGVASLSALLPEFLAGYKDSVLDLSSNFGNMQNDGRLENWLENR